jgi:16S rRNA (cytidine1402-2'-O)-methyltransferase
MTPRITKTGTTTPGTTTPGTTTPGTTTPGTTTPGTTTPGTSSVEGTLTLVATPIGNLGDLSPRAVDALRSADLICCEDTRRTGKLLHHAGISGVRMTITNDHTETERVHQVLSLLADGRNVVVVSDAGTPGISDPGERLVTAAIDAGHTVSAVPGPAAVIMAATVSGLPCHRLAYEGFIPRSGRARTERLAEIAVERRTVVLYEAPHRLARTLTDLGVSCGGERRVAICRELTKMHEEVWRGTLDEAVARAGDNEPIGEHVIVMEGAPPDAPADHATIDDALRAALAEGLSTKDAAARVATKLGVAKRTAYDAALRLGSCND